MSKQYVPELNPHNWNTVLELMAYANARAKDSSAPYAMAKEVVDEWYEAIERKCAELVGPAWFGN